MWFALLFLIILIPLASIILDSQLGRALAARLERRPLQGDEALERRLSLLESEVERIGRELQRLEEESEFLHRLLANRPGSAGQLPANERDG
ncbi:MAG TPA: hypothetical protein VNZ57_01470 [Longimicrobiales bacterium]|nr:hypothetical protein [Longimicrobiales bacterium]